MVLAIMESVTHQQNEERRIILTSAFTAYVKTRLERLEMLISVNCRELYRLHTQSLARIS